MKNRYATILVLAGLGALSYLGLSTTASNAQTNTAPKEAATPLERKVEQLEKQVALLQKQVEELKQRPMTLTYMNPIGQAQPSEPPPGTPFEFNGRTYYRVPLKAGSASTVNSGEATAVRVTPVTPGAPAK